jgi:hypothetical protein
MEGENRHFSIGTRVLPEQSWGTTALVVPPATSPGCRTTPLTWLFTIYIKKSSRNCVSFGDYHHKTDDGGCCLVSTLLTSRETEGSSETCPPGVVTGYQHTDCIKEDEVRRTLTQTPIVSQTVDRERESRHVPLRDPVFSRFILTYTVNPRYATSRKVAGSSPDEVDYFQLT